MDKMLCTINQACASTGLSYYCIRNWIREGKIICVKSGTRNYINVGSLKRYIAGEKNG